jgi:hypothetical protein
MRPNENARETQLRKQIVPLILSTEILYEDVNLTEKETVLKFQATITCKEFS